MENRTHAFFNKKIGSGVTPRGGASVYQDEGIIFLRSQNIYDQGLRIDDVSRISNEIHEKMSGSKVMKDDVLLNITGASIGRSSIFNLDEEANVNQHVCIIRPNEKVVPEYLHFLMQSEVGKLQVKLGTTGGNREGLNFEAIKKFRLPIPKRKEQYEILNSVSTKLNDLHLINSKLINQIQLLKNYRQSIISEAVTGKIDVREWETKK
ncbi:hypothetical protein CW751_14470 [Brumimicrobium salinarum]|uniref:Type I restriction modification DNA specificity domain-containing protein n=1 Tax=Brumimicrobium salinarum TaxID=2058658 RepID=A0A2I0QYZ9_9FLAO|nr:restriction endonuclease subunit S [Brumimicrobium salinarum]PKR79551.1 hypothetical protein CW751_14470 [Brumimicrobium salinarum]